MIPPGTQFFQNRNQAGTLRRGFSLVEIVIVIGVIGFCLIPLIGTMSVAYDRSRIAQEHTDVALVLQSAEARLRGLKFDQLHASLSGGGLNYYFAKGGRFLGTNSSNSSNFYRCNVRTNALPVSDSLFGVTVFVEYPAPGYQTRVASPLSIFRYGPQW